MRDTAPGQTKARYLVLLALFVVSSINFGDRAAMAVAGPAVSAALHLDPVAMGYVLAAFAISYVIAQVPGGALLDRYGSRWIYTGGLALWSLFTLMQGWAGLFSGLTAAVLLFVMRFAEGIASAPSIPANARIAASWFPASERGLATAIFNASQYFSLVVFAPLMGWLVLRFGWPWVFFVMGGLGLAAAGVLPFVVRSPLQSPLVNQAELSYIERGGALVHIESKSTVTHFTWENVRRLIVNRMLLGVYLGQYCVGALTYFFATWLPIYLVQQRGLSILNAGFLTAVPAICGFAGGISGGLLSDAILRRTGSLTAARKAPVLIGMAMAGLIVACNFTASQTAVIVLMSIAFFGKGLAALGWTVISDVSPKELVGLTGGVFNTVSNIPGIVTPIVIGYIVARLGSFDWALAFVAAHCLIGVFAYFAVVRKIERIELVPAKSDGAG